MCIFYCVHLMSFCVIWKYTHIQYTFSQSYCFLKLVGTRVNIQFEKKKGVPKVMSCRFRLKSCKKYSHFPLEDTSAMLVVLYHLFLLRLLFLISLLLVVTVKWAAFSGYWLVLAGLVSMVSRRAQQNGHTQHYKLQFR